MVLWNSLLRVDIAEHVQLLIVFSAHAFFLSGCVVETREFSGTGLQRFLSSLTQSGGSLSKSRTDAILTCGSPDATLSQSSRLCPCGRQSLDAPLASKIRTNGTWPW